MYLSRSRNVLRDYLSIVCTDAIFKKQDQEMAWILYKSSHVWCSDSEDNPHENSTFPDLCNLEIKSCLGIEFE